MRRYAILLVAGSLALLVLPVAYGDVYYYVSRGRVFSLPAYDTEIGFSSDRTLSSAYRSSSRWYFNDYWFSVQHANLTVSTFFEDDTLAFSLEGNATLSTTQVYLKEYDRPDSVSGCDSWEYNIASNVLSVYATQSPDVTVKWDIIISPYVPTNTSSGSSGSTNGETSTTSVASRDLLPLLGLVAIVGSVGLFTSSALYKRYVVKSQRQLRGIVPRGSPRKISKGIRKKGRKFRPREE